MSRQIKLRNTFTLGEINDMNGIRDEFQNGNADLRYETGLADGRGQLLHEIYQRTCEPEKHPERCPCEPCDILKVIQKGRQAFFITDETTTEASRTRSRQSRLHGPLLSPTPELGHGKDPDCTICHGDTTGCMLDTINWRLCPHAN